MTADGPYRDLRPIEAPTCRGLIGDYTRGSQVERRGTMGATRTRRKSETLLTDATASLPMDSGESMLSGLVTRPWAGSATVRRRRNRGARRGGAARFGQARS